MSDSEFLEIDCISVNQPIGTFYIGRMNYNHLTLISYADVRRIEQREVEVLLGIQRPLDSDRVEELRQYVRTIDASFPTSVILAITSENAEYDEDTGVMKIRKGTDIAKIIDGQHRIAGLISYEGPPFQINVTIFIDMDIEDQALLFATINLKQTKVNKSLAYDLYEFAVSRSPQKTCHNIAKVLNAQEKSPFHGRIKILGRATGKQYEFLTQATFVERLMIYISHDPMSDRDLIKRRKKVPRATSYEERNEHLIFRNMFIDDKDDDIALVLWSYFTAVAKRWPDAWHMEEPGHVLNRTTGFAALMRLLPLAYLALTEPGKVPQVKAFEGLFAKVQIRDAEFTKETFIPGTGGEKRLFAALRAQSGV